MTLTKFKHIASGMFRPHRASTFSLELKRVFPVKTAEIDEQSVWR